MLSFLIPQNQQQNRGMSQMFAFDKNKDGSNISLESNIRSNGNSIHYHDYNHQFSDLENQNRVYDASNNGWGNIDENSRPCVSSNFSGNNHGSNNYIGDNKVVNNHTENFSNNYNSNNHSGNNLPSSSSTIHSDVSRSCKDNNNSSVSSDITYIGNNDNKNYNVNHGNSYRDNYVNNDVNDINHNHNHNQKINNSSHSSNANYNFSRNNEDDDVVVLAKNKGAIHQSGEIGKK
jgi:hypothetical protein